MNEQTEAVIEFMGSHRIFSLATVRSDGWPQSNVVGYLVEWPNLFFVISRGSQKFCNIARDPRVSISLGAEPPDEQGLRGLSLSARAEEVTRTAQIVHIDDLMLTRFPNGPFYSPTSSSMALMRATPEFVSTVRIVGDRSFPELWCLQGEELTLSARGAAGFASEDEVPISSTLEPPCGYGSKPMS